MKPFILALGTALLVGGALAQDTSFPDVPEDSFASEAVAELVELGIITGFPDGTFRGNEGFTRYQAALVISRLLDVIEEDSAAAGALSEEDLATLNNAVQELASELASFDERIAALEQAGVGIDDGESALSGEVSALTERLSALEAAEPDTQLVDQFTTLEGRVAALEEMGAAAPTADVTALQEQVTALNAQVNELQAQLGTPAADIPAEDAVEGAVDAVTDAVEPDIDLSAPLAAPEAVALAPGRSKFYFGVAGLNEINARQIVESDEPGDNREAVYRFRPRVKLGIDDIFAGFGVRAAADYGRQSLIENGSVALSGHLTYSFGVPAVGAYVGLGGGYQFSDIVIGSTVLTDSVAPESPFAGALLGAELGTGPITFFVEGTVDYYFTDAQSDNGQVEGAQVGAPIDANLIDADGTEYDRVYPTVAVGFNIRP